MSNRLNQEREAELQPVRMKNCKEKLESLGFEVISDGETKLSFQFKGDIVFFWPYSGWHTGKNIKDGRGFSKLLAQIGGKDETEKTIR